MKLTSSGLTHVGMKRSHNEDCLRIYRDEHLFIVADGMGGHASGEVASEMSVETLAAFYRASSLDEELTWPYKLDYTQTYEENRIRVGVQLSNKRIYQSSVYDTKLKGMGTTIVAVAFYGDACSVGHVGDSRVYLFRDQKIIQITEDHSLLNDYIKMRPGGMTAEEIDAFPHKNVIVRALGMKENVQVDVITQTVQEGDLFLLCSDGLSGMITDEEMQTMLNNKSSLGGVAQIDLDALCDELIEVANSNGGNDNITAVIIRCDGLGDDDEDAEHDGAHFAPAWSQQASLSTQPTPKGGSTPNVETHDHVTPSFVTPSDAQSASIDRSPTSNEAPTIKAPASPLAARALEASPAGTPTVSAMKSTPISTTPLSSIPSTSQVSSTSNVEVSEPSDSRQASSSTPNNTIPQAQPVSIQQPSSNDTPSESAQPGTDREEQSLSSSELPTVRASGSDHMRMINTTVEEVGEVTLNVTPPEIQAVTQPQEAEAEAEDQAEEPPVEVSAELPNLAALDDDLDQLGGPTLQVRPSTLDAPITPMTSPQHEDAESVEAKPSLGSGLPQLSVLEEDLEDDGHTINMNPPSMEEELNPAQSADKNVEAMETSDSTESEPNSGGASQDPPEEGE